MLVKLVRETSPRKICPLESGERESKEKDEKLDPRVREDDNRRTSQLI